MAHVSLLREFVEHFSDVFGISVWRVSLRSRIAENHQFSARTICLASAWFKDVGIQVTAISQRAARRKPAVELP
jgi:hypothetical protein